jgi:hypothetical protein
MKCISFAHLIVIVIILLMLSAYQSNATLSYIFNTLVTVAIVYYLAGFVLECDGKY